MRRAMLILLAALILVVPAEASAFKYTHRITATATLTDHWTTKDARECGMVGDGTFTVQMETTASTRIKPLINKVGSRPVGKGSGLWVLGVPAGGGVTHMGPRKAKGTIMLVDNTVPNGPDCELIPRKDCGTFSAKGSQISVGGYDLRHLYANAYITSQHLNNTGDCLHGALGSWGRDTSVTGGDNKLGDMLFTMPSLKKFKKKKSLTLTKTDHKTSSTKYSESISFTDDVTRTITVKIEKL